FNWIKAKQTSHNYSKLLNCDNASWVESAVAVTNHKASFFSSGNFFCVPSAKFYVIERFFGNYFSIRVSDTFQTMDKCSNTCKFCTVHVLIKTSITFIVNAGEDASCFQC